MALTIHTTLRITPIARTRAAGGRGDRMTFDVDVEADGDGESDTVAIVPVAPGRGSGTEPKRGYAPGIRGSLAAQLIAQKLQAKSERRLARFFPERAHNAYLETAKSSSVRRPFTSRNV